MAIAEALTGHTWAEAREARIMELLAFLGRCGYQDADALSRNRPVVWLEKLALSVAELLKVEADAMRSAASGSRGGRWE